MQVKSETQSTASAAKPTPCFSKEARALLSGNETVERNALEQVSHAVYFR